MGRSMFVENQTLHSSVKHFMSIVKHGGGSVMVLGYFAELQQFCVEEWAKMPLQQCERLINNYRKCLVVVIRAKGGTTSY
jgi:hypothetical protein